jgi:hypothetical protein
VLQQLQLNHLVLFSLLLVLLLKQVLVWIKENSLVIVLNVVVLVTDPLIVVFHLLVLEVLPSTREQHLITTITTIIKVILVLLLNEVQNVSRKNLELVQDMHDGNGPLSIQKVHLMVLERSPTMKILQRRNNNNKDHD